MHYDGTLRGYFSTPIIKDKNTGKGIEVNRKMSPMDIKKLNQMYPCKPAVNPYTIPCTDKFGSCCDELKDEQIAKKGLSQSLENANQNIKKLEDKNEKLEDQMTIEKVENENLRVRLRQLEREMADSSRKQRDLANKVHDLTNKNQNLQNALDTCPLDPTRIPTTTFLTSSTISSTTITIAGTTVDTSVPKRSLLMFDDNARNGKNERAVITQGLSHTFLYETGEEYKIGNKDKIIDSYGIGESVNYSFLGACGVLYKGVINFFGGFQDYGNQHFGFDSQLNFVKYELLEIDFNSPQCITFEFSGRGHSGDEEVVLLCFDRKNSRSCYKYDNEKLTPFALAQNNHYKARLGKYKDQLITVGDWKLHEETEILDHSYNGRYKWNIGLNYNFSPKGVIFEYSMVNIPEIKNKHEYLLLIGGRYSFNDDYSDKIHRYDGKWSFFGNLLFKRAYHSSVLLDGRVFIIGGIGKGNDRWMKTEIWDVSKLEFETKLTWPELKDWRNNFVFIILY